MAKDSESIYVAGSMDWFERLTGFRERQYADTRSRLDISGNKLRSLVNGKSYGIVEFPGFSGHFSGFGD